MLKKWTWLTKYLSLFPLVDQVLTEIKSQAFLIEDRLLREQAVSSIENKSFHCYGGAVMALLATPNYRPDLVSLIINLQTISDYLDNLCDRAGIGNAEGFLRLHQAMSDAVIPHRQPTDYYALYEGHREDNYLSYLVRSCQALAGKLPSLTVVENRLLEAIRYYSHLQAYKHVVAPYRQDMLVAYLKEEVPNPHSLTWWELAAATGSTLGMFALLSLASHPFLDPELKEAVYLSYFPWICGLHILLDYLIDQEEDLKEGDLNFISFYANDDEAWHSLKRFAHEARQRASTIPPQSLHNLIVSGLLAMYMSDPKVGLQGYKSHALELLRAQNGSNVHLYHLCRLVRNLKGVK